MERSPSTLLEPSVGQEGPGDRGGPRLRQSRHFWAGLWDLGLRAKGAPSALWAEPADKCKVSGALNAAVSVLVSAPGSRHRGALSGGLCCSPRHNEGN